ncbi:FecCD family ABC transporter permease [Motilimonas eburnea]|uniref:FecCD family ABC transporter permease n=1 Tax=Motilimonas eburnea TaxID=1737488 RepID=UPI001E2F550E|nr:iron ABC transporter permease [Motilimonas eburnea]MCE2571343.1 iron ABC transporter permease [Motilimonas eburnea]
MITALASLMIGPLAFGPWQSLQTLLALIFPFIEGVSATHTVVMESLRLPRTLLCLFIGANLAICGAMMQGLFRNALADPAIVGVSSGAALGAAIAIYTSHLLFTTLPTLGQELYIAGAAFLGGTAVTLLVLRIATTRLGTSVSVMLLAGIAITALSSSGIAILYYFADDTVLRNILAWQLGSLVGANWIMVALSALVGGLLLASIRATAAPLNALLLGESEARYLGVNVQRLKYRLIALTALAVGVSVACVGLIGFVGLVVPHLVRLLVGPDHRNVLPLSALLGACLLLVADLIARTALMPIELPVGVVMGMIGAPFFIYLLLQQRNHMV